MPIYEYCCEDCQQQTSVFIRSISNPPPVGCRFCHGQRLTRLISRIITPKSEESRLESLGDPSALGGVDENDPKDMARWMKQMSAGMGEDVGSDVIDEMEPGADAPGSDADESPGW
jgi:putative FmdB family regulatory protein